MSALLDLSAIEIAARVRTGALSAEAVVEAALADIAARDRALNCFTSTFIERARARARRLDQRIARGEDAGSLAGAPFAAKNLFDVAGEVTLAGAKLRQGAEAAREDAFAITQLESAGAILIGATNMDEFAYGFATENAHFGPTRNPHAPSRIAGGSSGGSAAAVAAGFCPISLGSDTNGSVRVPAALCGVFGIKPTLGRLSRRGMFPFVHSLDTTGLFARTLADLEITYCALGGRDQRDPDQIAPGDRHQGSPQAGSRLRIGALGEYFREGASEEALAALDAAAGALDAKPAHLPFAREARAAAFSLTMVEGGALHAAQLRRRVKDYDPAVRDRLIAGALAPSALGERMQRFRRWFRDQARTLFERFDVVLAPATPFAAPPIGQAMIALGGREVSVRAHAGLYTQVFSFIGLPVIAAPHIRGLPVGVQIIAPAWREDHLFAIARELERQGVCQARNPTELSAYANQ